MEAANLPRSVLTRIQRLRAPTVFGVVKDMGLVEVVAVEVAVDLYIFLPS
jgi:hypothetical protein